LISAQPGAKRTESVIIEGKWQLAGDHVYLFARPTMEVDDQDWINFFNTELDGYDEKEIFVLIDVVGVEEKIGYTGFAKILALFQGQGIQRACIAALPSNDAYPLLTKLFSKVADVVDYDLELKLISNLNEAEQWLASRQVEG
jgi:hypothetical protein